MAGAQDFVTEFLDLENRLADPTIHADASLARRLGRRYAELTPIVSGLREKDQLSADIEAARELAEEDPVFLEEISALERTLAAVDERLVKLLAPRDPHDSHDAIMEIKSGEGGEESALFAKDLFTMYTKFIDSQPWSMDVLDSQETDLGGLKSITFAVKGTSSGDAPYGALKFEGGVHRVQRVPVTESQGRIHTSAAGVMVMPEMDDTELVIDPAELKIDVFRSSGPGGQGVNTTDSAVRITHLPTGTVVSCQNERSQLQNKESALRMLRARLTTLAEEEAAQSASQARKSQVRTVDRSERIRTYNFPENRIADHRIGYKAHNLDAVLAGDIGPLMTALQEADLAVRLTEATQGHS
ncbi:MAG: peptide chain release factor 1 [Propionibacteriaceae bacterium]|nr:peptide chain release factor 1 [Propionibacteriaceae bacterium]